MPAYAVVLIDVKDPEQYRKYTAVTPGIIARHGGRFLVRGGPIETLEGPAETRRLVVIEFPTLAAARGFYESPEYLEARKLRDGAAIGTFMIVDGWTPAP